MTERQTKAVGWVQLILSLVIALVGAFAWYSVRAQAQAVETAQIGTKLDMFSSQLRDLNSGVGVLSSQLGDLRAWKAGMETMMVAHSQRLDQCQGVLDQLRGIILRQNQGIAGSPGPSAPAAAALHAAPE